jgi:hypothetical protein
MAHFYPHTAATSSSATEIIVFCENNLPPCPEVSTIPCIVYSHRSLLSPFSLMSGRGVVAFNLNQIQLTTGIPK